jgi:hypothetical protein
LWNPEYIEAFEFINTTKQAVLAMQVEVQRIESTCRHAIED